MGVLTLCDSLLSTVLFSRSARSCSWFSTVDWLAFVNGFLPPSSSLSLSRVYRFFGSLSSKVFSYIPARSAFVFIQTLTRLSCMNSYRTWLAGDDCAYLLTWLAFSIGFIFILARSCYMGFLGVTARSYQRFSIKYRLAVYHWSAYIAWLAYSMVYSLILAY